MNIVHKDINNEKMIDMWMMDGEEITPVRENIPRKKVLKDVPDIPQVIVRTSETIVNAVLNRIIEKVVSDTGLVLNTTSFMLTAHYKNYIC